VVTVED